MANSLVNGTQVASAMVGGLLDAGVLVNACWRDADSEIVAGKGQTISVRSPNTGTAANFSAPATVSDHTETNIAVALAHQPYEQVELSAKEKTLNVEDFYNQVVMPRLGGIAEYLEDQIATELATTTSTEVGHATDAALAVAAGFEALGDNKVPMGDRYLACSPSFAAALLGDKVLSAADTRADQGQAMQEAYLGRLYGFTVITSAHITDLVTGPTAYAYHQTGLVAAFRTPALPEGGADGAVASAYGMSARLVLDWSQTAVADVLHADTLAGFALSENERVIPVAIG